MARTSDQTLEYRIGGMDCASCAATIRTALERMPGVSDLNISVQSERLSLRLAPEGTSRERVEGAIASLGYSASALSEPAEHDHDHDHEGHDHGGESELDEDGRTVMSVGGMDCASCAVSIRSALETMPGVSDVRVSVPRERVSLALAPGSSTTEEEIRATITRLGYTPGGPGAAKEDKTATAWWQQPKLRQLLVSALIVALAYAVSLAMPALHHWAFGLATLLAVWPIAQRAVAAARLGAPFTIQMLMTLAAVGAVIIGEYEEAAVVVLLFLLGEVLEGVAADRARSGIRALGELLPREARVEDADGALHTVAADTLRIGQIVLARPGDRIAADGEVISGTSSVDESAVTGESLPVTRAPGDAVRAGTVNHEATLRIRVARSPEDNTIARIIALVEEAQESKAPTERFIDRFSRYYMPAIVALAALVAILPPLAGFGPWETWIYRGLALLLIGCPCALVISVPAAVASGLSAGARAGILIKGGAVLESLADSTRVVFDKTGTLTRGTPEVTDVIALDGDEAELLARTAAVEAQSSHPLAAAILAHAKARGETLPVATEVRAIPGKGMEGVVDGQHLFVGAPRHAAERAPLPEAARLRIETLEQDGKTVTVVVSGDRTVGLVALRDTPRDDAEGALQGLRERGIAAVMMTGDNTRTGAAIGRQLGIEVEAEMLPEDKARRVAQIAAKETVVMVGDGVNDAPALAAAHVGVAVGSGTDVAMEAADAALMRNRVDDVPRMIDLSRATMRNIRQNVTIALGLKAVFLVTTLTGLSGLWLAIMADTGATVLVTANAMRLLGFFRGR